ncbi:hypothetical protein B0H10DRAFT_1961348 [Mycena sp. CBHHK59/15]|nr:hypothetical protein B0H10DRAFT_1961348 [Mycena sp. CBHHK59/15]
MPQFTTSSEAIISPFKKANSELERSGHDTSCLKTYWHSSLGMYSTSTEVRYVYRLLARIESASLEPWFRSKEGISVWGNPPCFSLKCVPSFTVHAIPSPLPLGEIHYLLGQGWDTFVSINDALNSMGPKKPIEISDRPMLIIFRSLLVNVSHFENLAFLESLRSQNFMKLLPRLHVRILLQRLAYEPSCATKGSAMVRRSLGKSNYNAKKLVGRLQKSPPLCPESYASGGED